MVTFDMAISGVKVTKDNMKALAAAVEELTHYRVMVGVPDTKAGRKDGAISNAALAYIHENGAPEAGIPARPFLKPTVRAEQKTIQASLRDAGTTALSGKSPLPAFNRLGLKVSSAVKTRITSNIPPPLALSTVEGRIRRRKSKKWRATKTAAVSSNVAAGQAPGAGLFTALVDTGQLRNSVTYVVRRTKT